MNIFRNK